MTPANCNAILNVSDGIDDEAVKFVCQLPCGHAGPHREVFKNGRAQTHWLDDEGMGDDLED